MANTLTTLANTKSNDELVLKTSDGTTVVLNSSKLEKWLSAVEKLDLINKTDPKGNVIEGQDEFLATQFISRFGFQKPKDLITFLNSPEGDVTLSQIGAQLADIANFEENRMFEYYEEEARHQRVMTNLMLYMIYKKDKQELVIKELLQDAIDKLIHKNDTPDTDPSEEISYVDDENLISYYNRANQVMKDHLDEKLKLSEELKAEIQALEKQEEVLGLKYNSFNEHIGEVENISKFLDLATNEEPTIEKIKDKITQLQNEMRALTKKIQSDLENGDEDSARENLQYSNALNLQTTMLKDMISVIEEKSILFNQGGEETKKFEDAHFIIPADKVEKFKQKMESKKLVKSKGEYFLIDKDQNLEDNSVDRAAAYEAGQRAFQDLELHPEEIMNVKNLIKHNKELEQNNHAHKKANVLERSQELTDEISIITDQLSELHKARLHAEAVSRQSLTTTATNKPSATSTPPSKKMTPLAEIRSLDDFGKNLQKQPAYNAPAKDEEPSPDESLNPKLS
jgi:effector protein LidA